MRYGLALPTSGEFAAADSIGAVAEGAERIGLDSVWVFERLLSPTGQISIGDRDFRMPDNYKVVYSPLESLAFAAAKTSRIRLGTSIINALFYNPVGLGRSLVTLDRLSNGRILAGLGQGWIREEFTAAGVPTGHLIGAGSMPGPLAAGTRTFLHSSHENPSPTGRFRAGVPEAAKDQTDDAGQTSDQGGFQCVLQRNSNLGHGQRALRQRGQHRA